jgi:hypothetical protein
MRLPEWLPVYGDQEYRNKKCPVESAEQITFFNTLRRDYPELGRIAIHPRNEGKRTANQAQRQKAEGMTAGAADIIIPGSPAFVCELKRTDHTLCAWEPDQLEYLATAQTMGAFVCVALGHKAALEALEIWIGRK